MADTSLYDRDIVAWAEQQAEALRRLAASPAAANAVDWENVIEEIESVGRSELKGVESQLRNAIAHILKGYCDPDSLSRAAWSAETIAFLIDARRDFRSSMAVKLDLDRIWRDAWQLALAQLNAYMRLKGRRIAVPPGIPAECPYSLDELLAEDFDYEKALQRLSGV